MTSYAMIAALDKLEKLRQDLFVAIKDEVAETGHCKSYEGTFRVTFPGAFVAEEAVSWSVSLDLYVIGPSRHYQWWGPTLQDCVDQADAAVRGWMADE